MNVAELSPCVEHGTSFDQSEIKNIPSMAGCYVLTTYIGDILYIGLSVDLQRRMTQHLDDPQKTSSLNGQRATRFHWRLVAGDKEDLERQERRWLDQYAKRSGGALPPLNKNASPGSV